MIVNEAHPENLSGLCERDRHIARVFLRWTVVMFITHVLAGLFLGPDGQGLVEISYWFYGITLIPLVACYFMIRAFLQILEQADEMIRLILLKASVTGFGVMFVLGIVFSLVAQISGPWEDSGSITWVAGFLAFEFRFIRQWKSFNA